MKKLVFLFSIFLVSIFFIFFVIAEEHNIVCDDGDVDCKVDKAYSCLNEKIDDKTCEALSSEERVFSLLATGKCMDEVLDDSRYNSDLRFTSQALLGLHNFGFNTDETEEWILSQEMASIGIDWFLEIESLEETACVVDSFGSNNLIIGEDKKISSLTGGNCLSLAQVGYWLDINSNCYSENFTISCDKQFLTTLLYQKQGSDTIYVSEKTSSSSAEGSTEEKVNSLCFREGGFCDYEGSLWAALALNKDYDISPFLPYLVTNADQPENERFIPEAFLSVLAGDSYRNDLLLKQKEQWWEESGDKFYDTAVALLPFQNEDPGPLEKTSAKDWLLEVQGNDGCWQGNIRNTGFLLYSIWPTNFGSGDGGGGCERSDLRFESGRGEGIEGSSERHGGDRRVDDPTYTAFVTLTPPTAAGNEYPCCGDRRFI